MGHMRRQKLLLITYHFPPSAAVAVYRALGFVRYLPAHEWEVIVVAASDVPYEPRDPALLELVPKGTTVHYVPYPNTKLHRRLTNYLCYDHWPVVAWPAVAAAIDRHKPDVVLTTSPPGGVHRLGMWVQSYFKLPWIACMRDPWHTGGLPDMPFLPRTIASFEERRTLARADLVLANTPGMMELLKSYYPEHSDKITYLTNGFDQAILNGQLERLAPQAEMNRRGRTGVQLLHAGEIYNERNPIGLLEALRNLKARDFDGLPEMRLRLLGKINANLNMAQTLRSLEIEDIIGLGGQVTYEASLLAMMEADILVVLQSPRNRIAIPAKLYEYLGIGKPILALSDGGDLDWLLQASGGTYRIASPRDPAGIERAVSELARAVRDGQAAPPPQVKLYPFTREHMAEQLAAMMSRLLDRNGREAAQASAPRPVQSMPRLQGK